jgi:hypothetical protein
VSSDLDRFLAFFEAQKPRHAARFPSVAAGQVLTFMGTTGRAGTRAQVSVHRLEGLAPGPGPRDLLVRLRGELPVRPAAGDCVTVHLTRLAQYQGYQVKTAPLGPAGEAELLEQGGGALLVRGSQIYTVHHSPYTLRFYERVPVDEVRDLVGGLSHALVAVGPTANLSPRFVFHHEVRDGRLHLFHGDGLALKTFMNVRVNRQETRLVLDLDEHRGWALRGTVEEFAPADHPVAWARIADGFAAGSWSRPTRAFRFTAEAFEEIAPAGR